MENEEGDTDGPREEKLTVPTNMGTRSNAVSTFFTPGFDVSSHVGPVEAKSKAVEGLEFAHVTGSWGSMVGRKYSAAQGTRDNNEHQLAVICFEALVEDKPVIDKGDGVGAQRSAVLGVDRV